MPLQNRVTPFGEIVAVPERGTMMGNRGILCDADLRLRRDWAGQAWICCLLEFRGQRGPVISANHYTRLFFLDEPTALAAGHRPCAYCRRGAYVAFRAAWAIGNTGLGLGQRPRAIQIDRVLHGERLRLGAHKRLHRTELSTLPDGAFVTPNTSGHSRSDLIVQASDDQYWMRRPTDRDGQDLDAFLFWRGTRWRWTPGGYQEAGPLRSETVLTLTPPSIVAALANGYAPEPPAGLG